MKGSKKILIVLIIMIIGCIVCNFHKLSEDLQFTLIVISIVYTVVMSFVLVKSHSLMEWTMEDIDDFCWLIPLFYPWLLIYWIGKLADKYLSD